MKPHHAPADDPAEDSATQATLDERIQNIMASLARQVDRSSQPHWHHPNAHVTLSARNARELLGFLSRLGLDARRGDPDQIPTRHRAQICIYGNN